MQAADFPDVVTLKARWEIEKAAWFDYVGRLTHEHLNQSYGNEPQQGPTVWQTIMHVVMHGTQHRAEVAYILTGYGRSPGELDFGLFLQENR